MGHWAIWMVLHLLLCLMLLMMLAMMDSEIFMSLILETIEFVSLTPIKVCEIFFTNIGAWMPSIKIFIPVSTFAGNGVQSIQNGPALATASFYYPMAIAFQPSTSSIFVLDDGSLRKIQNGRGVFLLMNLLCLILILKR